MSNPEKISRVFPVEVKRQGEPEGGLLICWSDDKENRYSSTVLRDNCPCASCLEERGVSNHSTPLSPVTGRARLNIATEIKVGKHVLEEIRPVGNYAINLRWQDGHHTGIYSWEFLRDLESRLG